MNLITVHLDYSDGNYSMDLAWIDYCQGAHAWHVVLSRLDNQRYEEMGE